MLWFISLLIVGALLVQALSYVPFRRIRVCFKDAESKLAKRVRQYRKNGRCPPVYPNGWFALLASADLPASNVKTVEAFGTSFTVFRGISGQVYIVDAYCPHMGACFGVGGKVKDDCIICPFHEWCFSGKTGECVDIPYAESASKLANLHSWPCEEMNGFIYIWYHSENADPFWYPEHIPEIEDNSWMNACYKEIPENASDLGHFPSVHSSFFLGKDSKYFSWLKHKWVNPHWKPGAEDEKHLSYVELDHSLEIANIFSCINLGVKGTQIGPGIVHLYFSCELGKFVVIQNVTPLDSLLQCVMQSMFAPRGFLNLYSKFIFFGEVVMLERDIEIWNNKTTLAKPILIKEDKKIVGHRRWYSQFYSEHSPTLEEVCKELTW